MNAPMRDMNTLSNFIWRLESKSTIMKDEFNLKLFGSKKTDARRMVKKAHKNFCNRHSQDSDSMGINSIGLFKRSSEELKWIRVAK